MLDWKEPLTLDRVVERGLALFNATLPRCIVLAVLGGLVANLVVDRTIAPHEDELMALLRAARFDELGERFGLLLLGIGVLFLYLNSVVLHLVGTLARGQPGDAFASLAATLRALPQLLLGGTLYVLVLWFGTILLIAPGLWAAVALSFFAQAVLFDGRDGLRALGASFRLTRDRWWRTLTLYALILLATLIASLMLGLITGLLGAAAGWVGAGGAAPGLELTVASVIGSVLGLVLDGVLVAYYFDLKLRAGDGPRRDEGALGA